MGNVRSKQPLDETLTPDDVAVVTNESVEAQNMGNVRSKQPLDETLTPDDVAVVANELVEAQNKSFSLGLQLNLPLHEVEAIHSQYQSPQDRLIHVLIKFTRQVDHRPTWNVIIKALRAPIINLPALADKVEEVHSFSQAGPQRRISVQLFQLKSAPYYYYKMKRGSTASDSRYTYLAPFGSTKIFQYECSREKWEELPSCPYQNSGLVIIDGEVTVVGGWDGITDEWGDTTDEWGGACSNKLFTLRGKKWVEEYPPMVTARSMSAVVCQSNSGYLIVIGGMCGYGEISAVELFELKSRKWYTLTDLPQPLSSPSAAICGDVLHVIGEYRGGYSCSLRGLAFMDHPTTSLLPQALSWEHLPTPPVDNTTAASLCGQLLIIGGSKWSSSTKCIHQLLDKNWVDIGTMQEARHMCLVESPSPDQIIIFGGFQRRGSAGKDVTSIEKYVVTQ